VIIHDRKKAVATIMSRRQHKDGSMTSAPMKPEASSALDGTPDGRHAAAQDILAAMDEKSPQKLMEALANFHDLHKMHSEQAQPSEPDVPAQPRKES